MEAGSDGDGSGKKENDHSRSSSHYATPFIVASAPVSPSKSSRMVSRLLSTLRGGGGGNTSRSSTRHAGAMSTMTTAGSMADLRCNASIYTTSTAFSQNALAEMPDACMVEQLFEEQVVREMALLPEVVAKLGIEQKWAMVLNAAKLQTSDLGVAADAEFFLRAMMEDSDSFCNDRSLLGKLRIQLANRPIAWIREFVEGGGTMLLARTIDTVFLRAIRDPSLLGCCKELVGAVRAFTNNGVGLEATFLCQPMLNALALLLALDNAAYAAVTLNIFTAVAYTAAPQGVHHVINAMSYLQRSVQEEGRFDSFNRFLGRSIEQTAGSSLVLDGLIFVNALLENIDDPEMRIHVRNQIYRRPLRSPLDWLREQNKDGLITKQLNIFWGGVESDGDWLAQQYNELPQRFMGPLEQLDVLLTSLRSDGSNDGEETLCTLLQHLLCLRADAKVRTRYIRLLDRTLEALLLQGKGLDPDFCAPPLPCLTATELERLTVGAEVDALKNENLSLRFELCRVDELRAALAQRLGTSEASVKEEVSHLQERVTEATRQAEQRIHAVEAEKADLLKQLKDSQLRCKELSETMANMEAQRRQEELETQFKKIQTRGASAEQLQVPDEPTPVTSPVLNQISFPPADKEVEAIIDKAQGLSVASPATGTLPPPPPPPPPPAMMMRMKRAVSTHDLLQSYPKPSCKLRGIHWLRLPKPHIAKTIWEDCDMALYKDRFDFGKVDALFAATGSGAKDDSIPSSPVPGTARPLERIMNTNDLQMAAIIVNRLGNIDVLIPALEQMDESVFTPELAMQLAGYADKVHMLTAVERQGRLQGNESSAERLFIRLAASVRGFNCRIKFINQKQNTAEQAHQCHSQIRPYMEFFQSLIDSKRLRTIFGVCSLSSDFVDGLVSGQLSEPGHPQGQHPWIPHSGHIDGTTLPRKVTSR